MKSVQAYDVVILGSTPYMVEDILRGLNMTCQVSHLPHLHHLLLSTKSLVIPRDCGRLEFTPSCLLLCL